MFSPPFASAKAGGGSPFVIPQQRRFGYAEDLKQIFRFIFGTGRKNARMNIVHPGMEIANISYRVICVGTLMGIVFRGGVQAFFDTLLYGGA